MELIDQAISELCGLVAETLNVSREIVNSESGPLTLPQWDSFNHVNLMVAIETRYGIELDVEEIASMITVQEIARVLIGKGVFNR